METFFALLAFCAGNSPATGEFPTQRPVTWSFDVFFDLRLYRQLSKQWRIWWFEALPHSLLRHCNEYENCDLRYMLQIMLMSAYEISIGWMPQDTFDDMPVLVQVMAWCHQATGHYQSQCWPRFISPRGVIMLKWISHEWIRSEYSKIGNITKQAHEKCLILLIYTRYINDLISSNYLICDDLEL